MKHIKELENEIRRLEAMSLIDKKYNAKLRESLKTIARFAQESTVKEIAQNALKQ